MEMFANFAKSATRKLCKISLQTLSLSGKSQALEEVRGGGRVRALRETHALFGGDNGEQLLPVLITEEMLEADVKHHRDASKRGKRRDHFAVLELGQHGGRQAGMFSKVDEGYLLAEPQLAKFATELV